jgi:hypothetical protein
LRFRNPVVPAIVVGLEAFYFFLPETLQKLTIMHYLHPCCLVIDRGPFSVVVDASSAIFSVIVLVSVAALLVWAAGKVLCRTEVTTRGWRHVTPILYHRRAEQPRLRCRLCHNE